MIVNITELEAKPKENKVLGERVSPGEYILFNDIIGIKTVVYNKHNNEYSGLVPLNGNYTFPIDISNSLVEVINVNIEWWRSISQ